jgi:type II secretion system (T2SS) protein E
MLFGQRLVETGIVTVENVRSALRAQEVQGGRLGTNLLKKGFVDIDTLSTALSRHVGAPPAKVKHFEQIDRSTLQRVPARVAAKHKALPLAAVERNGKELIVAFRDPRDIRAIDEIALVSASRVRVFVAPELCILRYIERYYGVHVELDMPAAEAPKNGAPAPIELTRLVCGPSAAAEASRAPTEPRAIAAIAQASVAVERLSRATWADQVNGKATSIDALDDAAELEIGARTPSIEEMMRAAAWLPSIPEASSWLPSPRPPPSPDRRPARSIESAIAAIDAAEDRDAIGDAIADYLRSTYGVGLVFFVKDEIAFGWRGFGPRLDRAVIEAIAIPLDASSVLGSVFRRSALFRGAPGEGQGVLQSHFFRLMKCEPPLEVIIAPISVKNRVVNLVYAHAIDGGTLPESAPLELTRLCRAAGEAFVRLIKRQKTSTPPTSPEPS